MFIQVETHSFVSSIIMGLSEGHELQHIISSSSFIYHLSWQKHSSFTNTDIIGHNSTHVFPYFFVYFSNGQNSTHSFVSVINNSLLISLFLKHFESSGKQTISFFSEVL